MDLERGGTASVLGEEIDVGITCFIPQFRDLLPARERFQIVGDLLIQASNPTTRGGGVCELRRGRNSGIDGTGTNATRDPTAPFGWCAGTGIGTGRTIIARNKETSGTGRTTVTASAAPTLGSPRDTTVERVRGWRLGEILIDGQQGGRGRQRIIQIEAIVTGAGRAG